MQDHDLKNKPLVEAILEVRWALSRGPQDGAVDPHYKILLGRLYERTSADYPEHEELPSAQIPDEITGHVVKHRFRQVGQGWPLVQIGPGILTVNDTSGYTWTDFRQRALEAVRKLYDSHPQPGDLRVNDLVLRYIDAEPLDYAAESIFDFLKAKMRIGISLPEGLFERPGVQKLPARLNWQASFRCENPKGTVQLRFGTGQKDKRPALLWETIVQSAEDGIPQMPRNFSEWLEAAHNITHEWFFRLIEGDLERKYRGE